MQYTEKELQKILEDHKLWLSGKGGKRAVLTNANLSNANLRGADLYRADLSHADLSGADLSNANLILAALRYAKLSGANFYNANFYNANLFHADLTDADLTGADLRYANLRFARFRNTLMWGETVNKTPLQLYDLPYSVLITDTMMKIGCQLHSIDDWLAFTVEEIENMDRNAKKFYENYRKLIQADVISHRIPKEENKES